VLADVVKGFAAGADQQHGGVKNTE
jgi:hypothetical protein